MTADEEQGVEPSRENLNAVEAYIWLCKGAMVRQDGETFKRMFRVRDNRLEVKYDSDDHWSRYAPCTVGETQIFGTDWRVVEEGTV